MTQYHTSDKENICPPHSTKKLVTTGSKRTRKVLHFPSFITPLNN